MRPQNAGHNAINLTNLKAMTTDFRALCAELLMALENAISIIYCEDGTKHISTAKPIVNRARAALADGRPSDEELWELYQGPGTFSPIEYVHDLLARRDNSAPQPPADGEVAELVAWLRETGATIQPSHLAEHQRYKRAAELLQRQALVPVAVSERMPESKDCDADGMCWWWSNVDGSWYLRRPSHPIVVCSADLLQIWLPAHALPVPEVGE